MGLNAKHERVIAETLGVIYESAASHGLFGSIDALQLYVRSAHDSFDLFSLEFIPPVFLVNVHHDVIFTCYVASPQATEEGAS